MYGRYVTGRQLWQQLQASPRSDPEPISSNYPAATRGLHHRPARVPANEAPAAPALRQSPQLSSSNFSSDLGGAQIARWRAS